MMYISVTILLVFCLSATATAQCEGNTLQLSDPEGIILSPGYPQGYQRDLSCIWEVRLHEGQLIYVYINDLDLVPQTSGATCGDYLEIKDGTSAAVLPRRCGNMSNVAITNPDHVVTVIFHSGSTGPTDLRGFNISYQASGCLDVVLEDPFTSVVIDDTQQVTRVSCANGKNVTMTCEGYRWNPTVEEAKQICRGVDESTTAGTQTDAGQGGSGGHSLHALTLMAPLVSLSTALVLKFC